MTTKPVKPVSLTWASAGAISVVETIINNITYSIIRGEINLGDKLPNEYELSRQMGVSRNSLREAMKTLSAIGVVDIRRGDGTYIVTNIKPNSIDSAMYSLYLNVSANQEILETRHLLDEMVLRAAIGKCTEEQIAHMQELNNELARCLQNGDYEVAAQLDFGFHKYIVSCLNNSFIEKIVISIYAFFEKSIKETIKAFSTDSRAYEFHQKMIGCIKNKDIHSIYNVVEESLRFWKGII